MRPELPLRAGSGEPLFCQALADLGQSLGSPADQLGLNLLPLSCARSCESRKPWSARPAARSLGSERMLEIFWRVADEQASNLLRTSGRLRSRRRPPADLAGRVSLGPARGGPDVERAGSPQGSALPGLVELLPVVGRFLAQLLAPFGWWRVGDPPAWVDRRGDQWRRVLSRQDRLESRGEADLDPVRRVLAQHVQHRSLHVEQRTERAARRDAVEEADAALAKPAQLGGSTPSHLYQSCGLPHVLRQ